MISVIPAYQIYCNGCGCSTPTDEIGIWSTAEDAETHAINCDWLFVAGEKHYCLDCIEEVKCSGPNGENESGSFKPKKSEPIIMEYRAKLIRVLRNEASERDDSMWDDIADFIDNLPIRLY